MKENTSPPSILKNKKLWLIPLLITALFVAVVLLTSKSYVSAPFTYTIY